MVPKLRYLYTPIQPAVSATGDWVTYQEFLPVEELQPYIYCYWQLKTLNELSEPFNYRVVSDGCIDIFFELNHNDNFVMGFCKEYTEFELRTEFNYVGIRFLPTIFPHVFDISALELSNKCEFLDDVLPDVSTWISDNFDRTQSIEFILEGINHYFLNLIGQKQSWDFDNRLYGAMDIIMENYGVLNVEKDLDVGLSPRQLRRLFQFYVGDTTKTFSKVVQFQNILKAKPSKQSLKRNKLFYDLGYYDQAHFIKDFKNFYGVTPSKAFNRE